MRLLPQTLIPRFLRPRTPPQAASLNEALREAARDPLLYAELGLPDTLDGRVEALRLYGALLFLRLRRIAPNGAALWQDVLDLMMADIERGFREVGVGDVSIPKKMRRVAEGFYGRVRAYEAGLAAQESISDSISDSTSDDTDDTLAQALERNVWLDASDAKRVRPTPAPPGAPARLAEHARALAAHLDAQADEALMRGVVSFDASPTGAA